MILTARVAAGIAAGTVSLAFRRWKVARVRSGSTFRTTAGVVSVGEVSGVTEAEITAHDAAQAGAASVAELVTGLRGDTADPIFRIELAWVGPDPRTELGDDAALGERDCADLDARLAALDRRSRHGAWTRRTLRVIADLPGTRAESLRGDVEKDVFKRDVRALKELGLTRSLSEGYELTPRGRAYLARRPPR